MAKLGINTGTAANAGDGSALRAGGNIINANFDEIYEFLESLNVSHKVSNPEELSQLLVEEMKENKEKNEHILKKIENYGSNTLNNVLNEIRPFFLISCFTSSIELGSTSKTSSSCT